MAGYQCMYHDGPEDAVHIHQTLGSPGVISTCGECEPLYHIRTLADGYGIDAGELYDSVRALSLAAAGDERNQPQPEDSQPPDMPAGPHPAMRVTDGRVTEWLWCECDSPVPHSADVEGDVTGLLDQLREETCPYCGEMVRGTAADIDSGLRRHVEYCPKAPGENEAEAGQ